MVTALSQYFHKDDSLALFNGTHNNYLKEVFLVLKEEKNIRKITFKQSSKWKYSFLKIITKKFFLM